MTSQETLIPKKKKRGPAPSGHGKPIVVRLHEADLAALDAWISEQSEPLTRPEALRRLARQGMEVVIVRRLT